MIIDSQLLWTTLNLKKQTALNVWTDNLIFIKLMSMLHIRSGQVVNYVKLLAWINSFVLVLLDFLLGIVLRDDIAVGFSIFFCFFHYCINFSFSFSKKSIEVGVAPIIICPHQPSKVFMIWLRFQSWAQIMLFDCKKNEVFH